uniref:Uncharacterized protein n=1 Tax=viral metagenome TaxID=1070528 RepID=A0A6M3IIY9_9ZZZZ
MTEDAINNTYQILEEFKCKQQKQSIYKSPLPLKKQRITARGRSGKVKHFTEEQIFLYKLKKFGRMFKNLTICGD